MLQNGSGGSEHLMDAEEIKEMRRRTEAMQIEARDYRPYNFLAFMGEMDALVELAMLDEMMEGEKASD